jgi:hypothetical protein
MLHHLTFGPDPIAQGTSRTATLGEPKFVRPLFNVRLCPKMLFRCQDNGGGKMRVDQLHGVFILFPLPHVDLAVKPGLAGKFPAHPLLDSFELRFHGRTSTTELSEP